jgi:hypothetical protein
MRLEEVIGRLQLWSVLVNCRLWRSIRMKRRWNFISSRRFTVQERMRSNNKSVIRTYLRTALEAYFNVPDAWQHTVSSNFWLCAVNPFESATDIKPVPLAKYFIDLQSTQIGVSCRFYGCVWIVPICVCTRALVFTSPQVVTLIILKIFEYNRLFVKYLSTPKSQPSALCTGISLTLTVGATVNVLLPKPS